MIRYSLVCIRKHAFESWFSNGAAYDAQAARGLVTCPECGTSKVEKALMAPNVSTSRKQRKAALEVAAGLAARAVAGAKEAPASGTQAAEAPPGMPTMLAPMPTAEQRQMLAALRKLKAELIATSEDVGPRFAEEARRIHYEEAEPRTIHGQATLAEARELHEEGVAVLPLPDLPEEHN